MSGIDLSTLNDEQKKIVTTLDEPLFVEAGAGSGKTFTLTRRIAWALSPGSGEGGRPYIDSLSQALVITFTNAAAQEIKERVRSTLRDAGMAEHALEVDSAWISTIHGMCGRILKRHALDLGLDPEFSMASGNVEDQIRAQALNEVLSEASRRRKDDPAMAALFAEYGIGAPDRGHGATGLYGVLESVIEVASKAPWGLESLTFAQADDVDSVVRDFSRSYGSLLALKLDDEKTQQIASQLEAMDDFLALPPSERTAERAAALLAKPYVPRSSKTIKEAVDEAKGELAFAQVALALARVRPLVPALMSLAHKVQERVAQLERAKSVLSADDLISLALEAVRDNPAVARDYAGRFRLVMVDEFQDTDERQLELIEILSGAGARHLATVGDAQQSIYRFRGADVSVFRGRGEALPESEHVRLSVNYRSHADVLSLVDRVCGGKHGVLDGFMHLDPNPKRTDGYVARDIPRIDIELTRGASASGNVGKPQSAVGAAMVADRLARLRDAGQKPGDMALLLGAFTNASFYLDAMRARGLECVVSGGSNFTNAPEVAVMAHLLHALANPKDTQAGLFPLLTSEVFALDANDLVQLGTRAQLRLDAPTNRSVDRGLETMEFFHDAEPSLRLRRAHEVMMRARTALRTKPVADVCLQVVRESGWLSRLERGDAAERAREANVLGAIRYIRDLTTDLAIGPARAADEFDRWLAISNVAPSSLAGGRNDAVRVMTVHSSKGLEFPVVAVADCWSVKADGGALLAGKADDGSYGCVLVPGSGTDLRGLDKKPKGMSKTLGGYELVGEPQGAFEWAAALRQRSDEEAAAEKTRLLYVALTRAREALVVACPIISTSKGNSDGLATDFAQSLYAGGIPDPGEHRLDFGGEEPAVVRVASVAVDKATKLATVDAHGALPALEGGPLGPDVSRIALVGTPVEGLEREDAGFDLFQVEPDDVAERAVPVPSREGVYSYSSAHALMQQGFVPAGGGVAPDDDDIAWRPAGAAVPTRAERDAWQEGAPVVDDGDKATSFGSAFHLLAQGMVESGRNPSAERVARMADYWRLSRNQRTRLDAALGLWQASAIRHEALAHGVVRAEVPFFCHAASRYGDYVEGAIVLLAYDRAADEAFLVDYKTGDRGLDARQIWARHEMQANFYASVLMAQGFSRVRCSFVCVEVPAESVAGAEPAPGEPFVARYEFDAARPPRI